MRPKLIGATAGANYVIKVVYAKAEKVPEYAITTVRVSVKAVPEEM